jgi:hypothetical protein
MRIVCHFTSDTNFHLVRVALEHLVLNTKKGAHKIPAFIPNPALNNKILEIPKDKNDIAGRQKYMPEVERITINCQ